MNERPNVTVIYQESPPSTPSVGRVLLELLFFLVMAGLIALISASCGLLL